MFKTGEFEGIQRAGCKSNAMGTGNGVWGWGDQAAMHPASYITTKERADKRIDRSIEEHSVSYKKQIIHIKHGNRELNKHWAPQYEPHWSAGRRTEHVEFKQSGERLIILTKNIIQIERRW